MPLTIELKVLDTGDGAACREPPSICGTATGTAATRCTPRGSPENYLREVQGAGSDESVTFTSIFPAAYSGRWPHVHFEVYPSLDASATASGKLRTSQLAFPEDAQAGVRHRRLQPERAEHGPVLT